MREVCSFKENGSSQKKKNKKNTLRLGLTSESVTDVMGGL